VLTTRSPASEGQTKAAVPVLTGADDPLAPPDQVLGFADEMRSAKVRDWQIEIFGNALHGFTNPSADGSIMRAALHDPGRTVAPGHRRDVCWRRCLATAPDRRHRLPKPLGAVTAPIRMSVAVARTPPSAV
jgi:dienelactone hydrolase